MLALLDLDGTLVNRNAGFRGWLATFATEHHFDETACAWLRAWDQETATGDISGLRPAEIWMIGDDPVRDVQGATQAGLSTVWISHQRPWPDDLPPSTVTVVAPAEALRYLHDLAHA